METFWHGNISGDILLGKYKGWKGRAAPWRNVRTQGRNLRNGVKKLCKTMWNKIWTDQDVKFQFFREEWWTIFKLWQHLWHFGFHCKINIFAKEISVPIIMWDIRGQTWAMVTCKFENHERCEREGNVRWTWNLDGCWYLSFVDCMFACLCHRGCDWCHWKNKLLKEMAKLTIMNNKLKYNRD